jgi:hypothetical protein
LEELVSQYRSKLDMLHLEKSQLSKDYEEYLKSKAHLELILKDLEESAESDAKSRVSLSFLMKAWS